MKKINLFELLSIGVIILIGCFILSFTAKKMFDIDTDFLSAAATFFAGVVAYKLFYDWRLQYRTELLERLKDRVNNLFVDLENEYSQLHKAIVIIEENNDVNDIVNKVNVIIDNIVNEMFFYNKIFVQYGLDESSVCILPITVRKGLSELSASIMCRHIEITDFQIYCNELKIYLEGYEGYKKIIDYKGFLNEDLQTLIINSITEKKGH